MLLQGAFLDPAGAGLCWLGSGDAKAFREVLLWPLGKVATGSTLGKALRAVVPREGEAKLGYKAFL